MSMLDDIRRKIGRRQYELSKHAVDQSIVRDISVAEIQEALCGPNWIGTRIRKTD